MISNGLKEAHVPPTFATLKLWDLSSQKATAIGVLEGFLALMITSIPAAKVAVPSQAQKHLNVQLKWGAVVSAFFVLGACLYSLMRGRCCVV